MALNPTLAQTIRSFIKYELNDLNVTIPARVLEYDNEFQKATVQPIIRERYRDDKTTESDKDKFGIVQSDMPAIVGVPVIFPSANNGCINWPLNKGDIVQLLFSQRSLDLWLHSEDSKFNPKTINPEDNRLHDYSDAIAIPGVYPFKRALGSHPENFQIRYNVETDQECSISMTPQGDGIFDFPGKLKFNCNGFEFFNEGDKREQTEGQSVIRVKGDRRTEVDGKNNIHVNGTETRRIKGAVLNDFLSTFNLGVEGDIVRQSRSGKISDNSSGDLIVESSGAIGLKAGSSMDFEHPGTLDLDGSVSSAPTVPAEGSGALVISPSNLSFVETHNSSFQYSSKIIIVDNPSEGTESISTSISGGSNWLTLIGVSGSVDGFGQELIVVSLNKNVKNLAIGKYTDTVVISGNSVTINLEIKV